jgi:hypothetical protein
MADRWVKRWYIPKSSGEGTWTVAVDRLGNWGCSCPVWKFKRLECHHIKLVKANDGNEIKPREKSKYILAKVLKPTYKPETNELLIPLITLPDAMMMEATICYNLMIHGYSFAEVRDLRHNLPACWTKGAIFDYISKHGEAEYPETFYEF